MIRVGHAMVSLEQREAFQDGRPLRMGGRAFEILEALLRAEGRIVSKDELIDQVWPDTVVEENNLQVHISNLRKLLGGKEFIQTIPRRGYRLMAGSPHTPALENMPPAGLIERTAGHSDSVTVHIVDDDQAVRASLSRLLRAEDIAHQTHACAEDFLGAALDNAPACLLLDVNLPLATGFDLQQELNRRGHPWPIVFMTGHGTIPMSVQAIKAGAVEFLTKPFDDEQLLRTLTPVFARARIEHERWTHLNTLRERFAQLTPREREVLELLVRGMSNKQVANHLGTSEVTAKVHKKNVMNKTQASSVVTLATLFGQLNPAQDTP